MKAQIFTLEDPISAILISHVREFCSFTVQKPNPLKDVKGYRLAAKSFLTKDAT